MVKKANPEQGSFGSAAHFAIEPIQVMWQKKRVLSSLLALPCFIATILNFTLDSSSSSISLPFLSENAIMIPNTIWILLQPLWAIAWIRYIFYPTEKPTLKSYFTVNKFYGYFLGCTVLLQLLNMPMMYMEDLAILNKTVLLGVWLLWTVLILPIEAIAKFL